MHHALIVARIAPGAAERVAEIFAESDRTELPRVVGVRHRSLYQLGDLYLHLLVTDEPATDAVGRGTEHPEFARVSQRLRPYISPYLPTWQSPRDAMARCFYHWDAPMPAGSTRSAP
ncbi:TcmI family type II polyketide cyclase [Plantactinospora siamensis]|uniref:TcmI family type II polyketide cyclase n=1 Tax=Plantactinospora siamensis TaxID=555372 RepID=A0ABV6P2Q3_9ACTN